MQLVDLLAAGVRGAENGYARIVARGTQTLADCFSDYQGTVLNQPSGGLVLDAHGGIVVYVDQEVYVDVLDADGESVRQVTVMHSAGNVEYIGQSFTGTDYRSAARGAGEPVTVQEILDGWKTSAGARDFNVLFNGASTRIQDALGSVAGIFYNVKSPEFGAVGDGTTDDTNAIQNCMTAAAAAGSGIVYFPTGIYRHTSGITVAPHISLWGGGAGSVLFLDHATANSLNFTGSSSVYQEIRNLFISVAQTNSGSRVALGAPLALRIVNSSLGAATATGHTVAVTVAGAQLLVEASILYVSASGKSCISASLGAAGNSPKVRVFNSLLQLATAVAYAGALVEAQEFYVYASELDVSLSTGSLEVGVAGVGETGQGPRGVVSGCRFRGKSTTTSTGVVLSSASGEATSHVVEAGNIFESCVPISGFVPGSANPQLQSVTRESLVTVQSTNDGTVDLLGAKYGISVLTRTSNAAGTLTSDVGPTGSLLTVVVYANGANTGTLQFGTGFIGGITAFTVNNGKSTFYTFRSVYVAGAAVWIMVSVSQANLG